MRKRKGANALARKFLGALENAATPAGAQTHDSLEELAQTFADAVRDGQRLALFLDYDGTLRGFTNDPAAAVPSEELRTLLRDLAKHELVNVAVVSGRPWDFLERRPRTRSRLRTWLSLETPRPRAMGVRATGRQYRLEGLG